MAQRERRLSWGKGEGKKDEIERAQCIQYEFDQSGETDRVRTGRGRGEEAQHRTRLCWFPLCPCARPALLFLALKAWLLDP